jgi:hypothetical protein
MNRFYTFWHRFHTFQQKMLNFILLHVVFMVGIAPASLVAKVVGKSFLQRRPSRSTWQAHVASARSDTLF